MYWEYEITDREFDELFFYMEAKQALDIQIKIKYPEEEGTITINTIMEYFNYNSSVENIREWIKQNQPLQATEFDKKYPNGKEWKW